MNNLKTNINGGFPFVLDDLRFLHDSYKEAIRGFINGYGNQAVIMSGCVRSVNSGTVNITEGYVIMSGEMFHFPAQSYPTPQPGEVEYFVVDVTYDPSGNKVFEDGQSHDTYEIRKAKLQVAQPPQGIYTTIQNAVTFLEAVELGIPQIAQNTNDIAGKSDIGHTHDKLYYSGSVKTQTKSNGMRTFGEHEITGAALLKGGVATIQQGAALRKSNITHFQNDDSLQFRVDFNSSPNWNGTFKMKDDGDFYLSRPNNRLRDSQTGSTIGNSSDQRLKRNVTPLASVIAKVKNLNPLKFLWNDKTEAGETTPKHFGFLAQELEVEFPDLVDTSERGYKSVDYPKLVVVLTKAIQEQQATIESMQADITALQNP